MCAKIKLSPLFQFGLKSFGKILTFYERGGEQKVRIYNKPSGPGSEAQLAQREIFKDKVVDWQALSPEEKATWDEEAALLGDPWSGYTLFMSTYEEEPPTDWGLNWTDLGAQFGEGSILSLAYLGNGIVLAGTETGAKILRSTDYGLTWQDTGV